MSFTAIWILFLLEDAVRCRDGPIAADERGAAFVDEATPRSLLQRQNPWPLSVVGVSARYDFRPPVPRLATHCTSVGPSTTPHQSKIKQQIGISFAESRQLRIKERIPTNRVSE